MSDIKNKKNDPAVFESREHLVRPRLNALFAQAIKNPLTIVCACMGCGKTRAAYDFIQQCEIPYAWIQLSEADNTGARFWDNFVHAVAKVDKSAAEEYKKIGLPNTDDKFNMYSSARELSLKNTPCIFVFDDVHLITNPVFHSFLERAINKTPEKRSIILISREMPRINISAFLLKDRVTIISDDELNFTENELNQFLLKEGLNIGTDSISKIYNDTKGWAFIIPFIARILKRVPGYAGYVQSVIKQDITQLLETELWNPISEQLRSLLLCLSLTEHSSTELVYQLAEKDENLISELKHQNTFIRFDNITDSFRMHHLLLDFLKTKRDLLSSEEKQKTYRIVALWCKENDYIIDALHYYEKVGDYTSIVSILRNSSPRFLAVNVQHLIGIFERAPAEAFDTVDFLAVLHAQVSLNLLKHQETLKLIQYYEAKYQKLPRDDPFRNRMLGGIYYNWAVLRLSLCTVDDCYDFDKYYAKMYEYLKDHPMNPRCWYQHSPGLWTNLTGASRAGAPQEFLNALITTVQYAKKCLKGLGAGIDDLGQGELFFYQGEIYKADSCITKALKIAGEYRQYEIVCRALFYKMRLAVVQGDRQKLELAIKDMENQLVVNEYSTRFMVYDLGIGWYNYTLNQPDKFPDWLKEKFTYRYDYANSFESFGNYIKAKYFWLKKDYENLLAYIEEKKRHVLILFEQIELLAMEACVHFEMNNKEKALKVLALAYETARPNGIVMPFVELGKNMRSLVSAAANVPGCTIPMSWLKSIKQRSSEYFRHQCQIISEYKKENKMNSDVTFTPRETAILHDLHDGLSRSEIAAKYGLSVNTVKLHINGIYNKTGAHKRADIFRVAAEYDLLK